jgi:hypothetical protein
MHKGEYAELLCRYFVEQNIMDGSIFNQCFIALDTRDRTVFGNWTKTAIKS